MLFQSTHPSGVRRPSTRRASPTRHFNPRTPVGCDVPVLVLACIGDRISIHAPQWGATSAYHQSPAGALFQSTHPSGVRPTDSAAIVRCKQFQSTHPSGVRPPSGDCGRSATADFNPRTPVGCDSYRHHHNKRFHPFQSTHPSGVRPFDGAKSVGKSSDFNPRTPVGCDDFCPHFAHIIPDFNPRTPVGCDPPLASTPEPVKEFQSTHPSGVRRGRHRVRPHHDPISIHAPQWGATAMRRRRPSDALFQSTHPSGVRPWRPVQVGRPQRISIHAPQWGATHALGHDNGAVGISIHAPQWGATADYRPARFQDWISIHAPQWGATTSGLFLVLKWIVFQSTHPSGVRRLRPVLHTVHGRISIHAPQWGATAQQGRRRRGGQISIHAPQWGATIAVCRPSRAWIISIHAPQWGATTCVTYASQR